MDTRAMFTNLLAAEWMKISRRPMALLLLGIFLALTALQQTLWFLVVALQEGTFSSSNVTFTILSEAAIEQVKRQLSLPGVFGAMLSAINGTGGILAIILTAGFFGSDFNWGTLRVLLTRAPHRGIYLLAKLAALQLALLVAMVITIVVGTLLSLMFGSILGLSQQIDAIAFLLLPVGMLRALLVMLPYTLIAAASAIVGRSVIAGVGGGLIFLAFDVSAGSLNTIGAVDPLIRALVNLLLQPNINRLIVDNSQMFGLNQSVLTPALDLNLLPSSWQAIGLIVIYSAIFGYSAYRTLSRQDIGGAN
ncbi:ABC transporter permease subunit [Chloroflexus sp.]|uniref:ABC transporter permease subunit n=1 Tax=Chloroflexus sp. TaxID=1904827 RepID=UPI00261B924F|nr:ABC transporter permease subunit [uncultured Chloroflexus sp.]